MAVFDGLSPAAVWGFFDDITKIPRASKKEERMREYLVRFARERGLDYEQDATGNLLIRKPAARGMERAPAVVLQGHMDMVCEKNSGVGFDFDADPIDTYVTDDGWVAARGTTLGADCGIGMAAQLAVLASRDIAHPAIEALFTVDEESGLTGAFGLSPGMLKGKYLINLDSEDEGELFIGCAGGVDTVATFDCPPVGPPQGYEFFRLEVAGLLGGHSGDDIDKGRANSNKLVARMLGTAMDEMPVALVSIDGGNLRNAIPREAAAVFGIPEDRVGRLEELFARFRSETVEEFKYTEPRMELRLERAGRPDAAIDGDRAVKLVRALRGVPNGVLAMSFAMPGLVETSTNLASVKPGENDTVVVTSSQRSSSEGAKREAAAAVASVYRLAGAGVEPSDGYPGWSPDPSSRLLKLAEESYERLFGAKPKVRAIHAGLECGLFLKKYPHLEMISFGPTIRGAHSPDERLEIATVGRFWELLTDVLAHIS